MVRTPACHAGGRRFEPVLGRHFAAMAQQAEHVLGKDEVTGSNPVSSSKKSPWNCPWGFFVFKTRKKYNNKKRKPFSIFGDRLISFHEKAPLPFRKESFSYIPTHKAGRCVYIFVLEQENSSSKLTEKSGWLNHLLTDTRLIFRLFTLTCSFIKPQQHKRMVTLAFSYIYYSHFSI